MRPTDVDEFLDELNAGIFKQKMAAELSEIAANVVEHGKAGKMTITLDIKQIGNGDQISVSHKLATAKPTKRGKIVQDDTTETPMNVNRGGRITLFPENQDDLFDKDGNPKLKAVEKRDHG